MPDIRFDMHNELVVAMLGIALVGCAGRDSQLITMVQPYDQTASWAQIQAGPTRF